MNHASLCSGIGGFDLAAEWMGWNNVFAVEKDLGCQKVLSKNFPGLKLFDDLYKFDGVEYIGAIDIISAGFPCQPFSQAGKQRGKEDDRHLWPEVLRIIKEVKPTFFVGENVPGIIPLALDDVHADLEGEGYSCQTFVIPACAVNAIHRRDRVWIVAYSEDNRYGGRSSQERTDLRERELLSREQKRGAVGSQVKRCIGIRVTSDPQHNGQLATKIGREARNHAQTSEKREEQLQQPSRENGLRKFDSDSNDFGIRRHERESFEEGTASCSNSPPNKRSRLHRVSYPLSQPTIRRGNDGISYRLGNGRDISPRQRTQSLKQLGNSVVPQLVYEVFKIIDKWNNGL